MEKKTYRNDIFVAVTLLLCLWFKIDSVMEYGMGNVSVFLVASCVLLLIVLLVMTLWLLFANRRKLWIILKGILKSYLFDTVSWLAFLMPIVCIEKYSTCFAVASWILGDIVLLGGFLIKNKIKSIK